MTVRHAFQPYVDLHKQDDGTYTVTFDWSDAYLGGINDEDEFPDHDRHHDEGPAATAAVDAWESRPDGTQTILAAPDPDADLAALADRQSALARQYAQDAARAAERALDASLLGLALTVLAQAPTVAGVQMYPSDQGDWMSFDAFVMTDGTTVEPEDAPDDVIELADDLDQWAMDLPDENDGWADDDRFVSRVEGSVRVVLDVRAAVAALAPALVDRIPA